MQFQNQVALITGGASGPRLLMGRNFATLGGRVVLTDIDGHAVEQAANGIREQGGQAIGVPLDVRDYAQVQAAVARAIGAFGRVDVLHNCAGGAASRIFKRPESFHAMPIEVIDWGLEVNLRGAVYMSHAVLGTMIQQGSGVIINMGSVTGHEGSAYSVDYATAKAGIIGLTKSLALCGAPHGVRACCISPGPVLTRPSMANMKTRLGRAADPQEIVDLILYLCSDKARFITGADYLIDGGRTCGGI